MTPLELRALAHLAQEADQGRWVQARTETDRTVLQQLFRKGMLDRQVMRPGKPPKFRYQALPNVVAEARRLGLIPENT